MNSKGFQIGINNEKPIRVGFDSQLFSINSIISSSKRKNELKNIIDINVGGLNSKKDNQYVRWIKKPLVVGYKVSIEVITDRFDPPNEIIRYDSEELLLESKLKAYYALKDELKDHIEE